MEIHLYNLPLDNTNNNVFCSADKRKSYFNLLEEVVNRLYDGDILSITTLDNRHIKMNDTTMSVVLPYSLETLNRYNYLWLSVPNARDKFYFIDERTSLNVGEKPSTSIKCTLDCFGTYYTEIFFGNYNKDIPCIRKSIQNFAKDGNNIIINKEFKGKCDSPNGQYQKIPCFHKGDEYREYDILFIQLTLDPTKDYRIRRYDYSQTIVEPIYDEVKNFDSRYGNMKYVFIPYCYFFGNSITPQSSLEINFGDGHKNRFLAYSKQNALSDITFGSEVILEAKLTCYPPFKYYYDYANNEFGIPATYCNRGNLMLGDNVIVDVDVIACTADNAVYNNYTNYIRNCSSPIYYPTMLGETTIYKNINTLDYNFSSDDNGKILNDSFLGNITASSYNVPYNFLLLSCGTNLIPISKYYANSQFYYNILPTADGIRIELVLTTESQSRNENIFEMSPIINSIFIKNTNYLPITYDNVKSFINDNINSLHNEVLFTSINSSLNAGYALNQIGTGIAQFVTTGTGAQQVTAGRDKLIRTGIDTAKYFTSLKAKFQDLSNQVSNMASLQGGGISNFCYSDRIMLYYCERTEYDSRNTKVLKDVYENGEYIDYIPQDYLSFDKSIFNAVITDNCSIPIIPNLRHRHTVENAFNNGVRYWNVDNMNVNCKYFQTNIINLDSGVI